MIISANQGTYKFVETDSILAVIERTLTDQGLNWDRVTKEHGKLHTYRLPDIRINDGKSDMVGQIYFKNSETPGTALSLYIGAYRFICANGLIVGVGEGGRLIHRVGPTADQFLVGLVTMVETSVDSLRYELQNTIDENINTPVVSPLSIIGNLPIQKSVKDSLFTRYFTGTLRDDITNVWGLYNNINELVRKHSRSASGAAYKDIGLLEHIKILNENSVDLVA